MATAVELDTGTGHVRLLDFTVVHDCGVTVNPALVTGQLEGAVAMSVGVALWEQLTHDGGGRLTSDRFKSYLLPRAPDLPRLRVGHMETPSPLHPLGMRGAGESGLGGAGDAAVSDDDPVRRDGPMIGARLRFECLCTPAEAVRLLAASDGRGRVLGGDSWLVPALSRDGEAPGLVLDPRVGCTTSVVMEAVDPLRNSAGAERASSPACDVVLS